MEISISLVIPVRNEEASIGTLIRSIRQQTRPPDEVILVDGGSTDRTVSVIREMTAEDPWCRVLEVGEATPGRGRNLGIAGARHEWIALTDAGIQLEPTWLEHLVAVVERDPSVAVVYGNFEPLTTSFFERCAALCYPPPKQERPGGWMRGPFIASSLIRRDTWEAAGGFPDLRAAEDLLFMERIQECGFKIGWAPTATVWWQLQPSFIRTFRKFVLYSRHNVRANRQRDWHYGLARIYLVALALLGLTRESSGWAGLLLAAASARVAKSIWDRREVRGILELLNPLQFFGVGLIMITIDLATFIGWAQATWERYRKPGSTRSLRFPKQTC
jgi:glycosyltransferase involved in cell wall biosynthesis